MRNLRLAVIGAGRLGRFHAQKVAARHDLDLVGVADPVALRRNRVSLELDTSGVADFRQLAADIDAAIIAVPTQLHHRLALDCIERGIHIFVEKPLAFSLTEAEEIVQAARRRGVVLQVGHVERFNPALTAARPFVSNPKYIDAVRASGFTFRSTDVGVVMDLMIHDVDLVLSMVRSPLRKVDALGLSVLGGHEDVANARLEFESGCVATLNASRVSYEPARRMNVWSPKAFASIDFATPAATLVHPCEDVLCRRFDVDQLSHERVEHYKEHLFESLLRREQRNIEAVDALALELEDFVDSVRTLRQPRVSGEAGRDAIAVAEQILAKINSHAWDDSPAAPVGPLAAAPPAIIPSPHWARTPKGIPIERREAG